MILLVLMPILVLAESVNDEFRQQHENSPYYQRAIDRGFTDYTWISGLADDYKAVGDKVLKTWMIVVDSDCGQYYQAIQKVEPYVVYLGTRGFYDACRVHPENRVLILSDDNAGVKKGQRINRKSYYVYQGLLDVKDSHGFPTKLPVLKQVLANKDPSLEKR